MMMPVMGGEQSIQLFKRINPSARIIVCSGLDISNEIQATVHGCIAKPYTAQTLIHMVRDVIDRAAVTA
jgi:DNA-binding NarL/FixJ family response regulator